MTTSNNEVHIPKDKSKNMKDVLKFVSENRVLIVLILVIAFALIWVKVKINDAANTYIAKKETLILEHKNTINSLNEAHIKQVTVVLSWAVRRHLLHDNLEEINLMFKSFVKENNVAKIQLINPSNSTVLISTDKNEEGQNVDDPGILKISTVEILRPNNLTTEIVVAPIIGLNQKEGILVVHYFKK